MLASDVIQKYLFTHHQELHFQLHLDLWGRKAFSEPQGHFIPASSKPGTLLLAIIVEVFDW